MESPVLPGVGAVAVPSGAQRGAPGVREVMPGDVANVPKLSQIRGLGPAFPGCSELSPSAALSLCLLKKIKKPIL